MPILFFGFIIDKMLALLHFEGKNGSFYCQFMLLASVLTITTSALTT